MRDIYITDESVFVAVGFIECFTMFQRTVSFQSLCYLSPREE